MSTGRWDPLGDIVSLREAMNNLLEESFVRPRGEVPGTPAGLAVDVRETNDAYIVTASVPGVSASDVDISVLGETLRIRGQRRESHESSGDGEGEAGRWLIRATNNGVTVLIDPFGRITEQVPAFEQAVLYGEVTPMQGLTPYLRWRSWPLIAVCLLLLGGAAWARSGRYPR